MIFPVQLCPFPKISNNLLTYKRSNTACCCSHATNKIKSSFPPSVRVKQILKIICMHTSSYIRTITISSLGYFQRWCDKNNKYKKRREQGWWLLVTIFFYLPFHCFVLFFWSLYFVVVGVTRKKHCINKRAFFYFTNYYYYHFYRNPIDTQSSTDDNGLLKCIFRVCLRLFSIKSYYSKKHYA